MSNVVAFKTHPSFEGKMETTLEGFLKRVKLWLEQRNGYDADHGATKYLELRLAQVVACLVRATANTQHVTVTGNYHNFDEEGNNFSYSSFMVELGDNNQLKWHDVPPQTDSEMINRCKHFIYQLVSDHKETADWETDLRPVWEESIPNADVESIIGNLLMMHQIPGLNLYELAQHLRTMLNKHRIELFLKDIQPSGLFYLYGEADGACEVVSQFDLDYEEGDKLVPLKPTVVDAIEMFQTTYGRTIATVKNRRTILVSGRL